MKNIIIIGMTFFLLSCADKLEDLNKNTKDPSTTSGESLFTTAQKALTDQIILQDVNSNNTRLWVQYACETQYLDESNYDMGTRNVPEQHWSELYRKTLKNLKEAKKVIVETEYVGEPAGIKENKLLIIELLEVYTFSILVETFGDIPYSEALDIEILNPKFDDGDEVYRDLIERIEVVTTTLNAKNGSFGAYDNIYTGDVSLWLKFANSLKLRMGMLYADVDNGFAKSIVESAVKSPAGFISNNDENANFHYLSTTPNTNPDHENIVLSGRSDYVATTSIIGRMKDLSDPRISKYFTKGKNGEYIGGTPGSSNTPADGFSTFAPSILEATAYGVLFSYVEVEFLLAEGAARGYNVGGTAEKHYNTAITSSIEYWGGTTSEAIVYLSHPSVGYELTERSWKEKIGTQRWLGMYPRGFESWTALRRLDFPTLIHPTGAKESEKGFPARYTYPVVEQTLNEVGWSGAEHGGDNDKAINRLWFDLHAYSH